MAATDLDLDALLDALTARARARAAAVELRNVAGDVVTPYASTGRLVVNPGDVIASVWGNTTFDQTVQAFDTPAARDAQWPAPKDGAAAYTADTGSLWVRRAGAWKALPLGFLAQAIGPAAQTDSAAGGVTLASVSVPVVAGRRYRMSCFGVGTQVTTASTSYFQISGPVDLGYARFAMVVSAPVGAVVMGAGVFTYTATATATQTWGVQSVGSVLRASPNTVQIIAEDIGA